MILDKISNADLYKGLSANLDKGLELLKDPTIIEKEAGKYEVDGDNLFYMIQIYETKTKEEMLFEAHKDYIDIQAVLDGAETIGWAPADELEVEIPYEPDVFKCKDPEIFTETKLAKGLFAIFFPNDAHKPCYQYNGPGKVHKIVIKVKI